MMQKQLAVRIGQCTDSGQKSKNQDFHGAGLPENYLLQQKGVVCAIADGISSSNVSHIASETAVSSFINDYFSTPESWSVKTSAERVITATNSWLFAQTQQSQGRFDKDRGYVCTLSALVLKHDQAHLFHIGDARIYRIQGQQIEQLTTDHRISLSSQESYLSRALGVGQKVEVDYLKLQLYPEDIFLLMTDGVYEYLNQGEILAALSADQDLNQVAKCLLQKALANGSTDNLTLQILQIDALPSQAGEYFDPQYKDLPMAPALQSGDLFEDYVVKKVLHQNHRSCLYLAQDAHSQQPLVIKVPATDLQQQPNAMEQFYLEEWVAKRIQNDYVMRAYPQRSAKHYLYQTFEYIEGQSLKAWLKQQNQTVEVAKIIDIVEQVAKALNAFHRLEMLHQDIRPENIMINAASQIKLIDFGSTSVKGIAEFQPEHADLALGTLAYMAPEYFLAKPAGSRSDQYSLAVLTYYLLTQQLPYGTEVAKCTTKKQLKKLHYYPMSQYRADIPAWFEAAVQKALHSEAAQRYSALSEFIYDLKHPNPSFLKQQKIALIEKNPVLFWRNLSLILILLIIGHLLLRYF